MTQEQSAKEFATRLVKFQSIYKECLERRYVINRKQFAMMIGISETTLSSAMNGNERYMTEILLIRAENALRERKEQDGIPEQTQEELPPTEEKQPNEMPDGIDKNIEDKDICSIVEKICTCVNTMCDTLNQERASHERIVNSLVELLKK